MLTVEQVKNETVNELCSDEEEKWLLKKVFGELYMELNDPSDNAVEDQDKITEKEIFRIDKGKKIKNSSTQIDNARIIEKSSPYRLNRLGQIGMMKKFGFLWTRRSDSENSKS